MAKSALGRAVSRVGASGGGKTYTRNRPTNYYGVLALIVILGLTVVAYSRYERQNPIKVSHAFPAKGSHGWLALSTEQCGVTLHDLYAYRTGDPLFTLQTHNVLAANPTVDSSSGDNARLSIFLKNYGLVANKNELGIPGRGGVVEAPFKYFAGTACAKGTKYAGEKAYPVIAYWRNIAQSKPTLTTDASSIVISKYMFVTFAFEPKGVTPKLPSKATIDAMYAASATTTTTIPLIPTTTTK